MRRTHLSAGVALTAVAMATTVPAGAAPTTPSEVAATQLAKPFDFDGNGFPDLVTGLPTMEVNGLSDAGGVAVYASSAAGVSHDARVITQDTPGVPDVAERDDGFGSAVASADFNADGYADLAVGASDEVVAGISFAGSVTVLYGSPDGLGATHAWSYTPGQGMTWFGRSLAAADFTGDGHPDLAVGAPGSFSSNEADAPGAVMVLRGGAGGLTATVPFIIKGGSKNLYFGSALAAGRLHRGTARADLVVAAEGDFWVPESSSTVAVVRFRRNSHGEPVALRQVLPRVLTANAVTVGDVIGDRNPDVIVGESAYGYVAPSEDTSTERGRVLIYPGTPTGPSSTPVSVRRSTPGVPGRLQDGDHFGADVAAGDVNHDGKDDLVVVASRAVAFPRGDGADLLLYGGSSGLARTGNHSYAFGGSPRLFDFNSDGRDELTVVRSAGATIYQPEGDGFTSAGPQLLPVSDLPYPVTLGGTWEWPDLKLGRAR